MVSGRKKLLAALLGGVLLLAVSAAALWLFFQVQTPHKGFPEEEKFVVIPKGASVEQIAQILESEGVIVSARLFQIFTLIRYGTPSLKAGEYRFSSPENIIQVAEKLQDGRVYFHRITIPEGLSRSEIVDLLVGAGLGSKKEFEAATRNTSLVSSWDRQAEDLEGYLFPETYFFPRSLNESEIVGKLVDGFRKVWTEERRRRAEEIGMSPRDVLTLASLIEKETAVPQERGLVSAVFHNRLQKNMLLACDPTVIYAVKRVKEYDGIIHQSDLDLDSPYNTYRYPGLPPGPIANPGEASIQAALFPASVDYLYFVSRNDGSHFFSDNYSRHSEAVRKYQRNGRP